MTLPHTPDGRYFVQIGKAGPRLWRAANPHLCAEERQRLTRHLMRARRQVSSATVEEERKLARAAVDEAKCGLGERGPVWWDDGSPDCNRVLVKNSPYAEWWSSTQKKT
nr:hypothetical protein [Sphingomonas piscis]